MASRSEASTALPEPSKGLSGIVAADTTLSFIDGEKGILRYRGYPIEQLAEHGDFLETCYLLLYGELTLHQPRLTVPHGQMHARAFVLVPLVEVATALQHPITLHQQPLNHWLTAVNMSDIRHLNDTGVTATATI